MRRYYQRISRVMVVFGAVVFSLVEFGAVACPLHKASVNELPSKRSVPAMSAPQKTLKTENKKETTAEKQPQRSERQATLKDLRSR